MGRKVRVFAALGALALALSGCAAFDRASDQTDPLEVFAAASLTEPMTELMAAYMAEHPEVEFAPLTSAGSQQLVEQINQGAPADVLALADLTSLESLQSGTDGFEVFAENSPVVVTTPAAASRIRTVADLANPEHRVVLCGDNVPCGRATAKLFSAAGVTVTPMSEEDNVKAVLAKVQLGEADAGVVYRSDVVGVDGVKFFVPPQAADIVNEYPIGAISDHPDAAQFIAYVRGDAGRAVLEEYGFMVPVPGDGAD